MSSVVTMLPVDQAAREQALDISRSVIVQAPAGSGKTELLTARYLRLLAVVDEPEQVLAITFARAATAEMRHRILEKLHAARDEAQTTDRPELEYARAALANSERRGWRLLDQPQRLNIQTIDSLCVAIAHRTPLLARLGGALQPTEQAGPLYALAARRTLERLGGEDAKLNETLTKILLTRDNNLDDCEKLLAEMLATREQWAHAFLLSGEDVDWEGVRARLEKPFQREIRRVLERAHMLLSRDPELCRELLELTGYSCKNLGPGSSISLLGALTGLPGPAEEFATHWRCLSELLLTGGKTWRKTVNVNQGFPASTNGAKSSIEKKYKRRMVALIDDLRDDEELLEVLCDIRQLPPPRYENEQWQLLLHLFAALRHAVAELRVVFAQHNTVDFAELSMAAQTVLRADDDEEASDIGDAPSELALGMSDSIRHLLVDEFQDTSRRQYELISMLVRGWEEGDGRTCFLVGDPMQSIYLFRQAEVELFEQVRRHGLGDGDHALQLDAIQLATNFRSTAAVVNPVNEYFPRIFEYGQRADVGSVTYSHSAARDEGPMPDAFTLHADFVQIDADARDREAKQVLEIVRRHLPAIDDAKARPGGEYTVALLARAKKHLAKIAAELREEDIPFRALELEMLAERQEILDLQALTRALLHPMDRVAWLAVLRAPWCGLELRELHALCGTDIRNEERRSVLEQVETNLVPQSGATVSAGSKQRVARVAAILREALRARYQQSSLSSWIERTWHSLGGPACVDATGYENAGVYFRMLEQIALDGIAATGEEMEQQLTQLFARPDPSTSERCGVQLMTIHKAKGLGFNVVIVPGMERDTGIDRQALICYLERSCQDGPELLVAPIGAKGEKTGALYDWVQKQRNRRETEERKRLLYVACTRSREAVHLFATATGTESGVNAGSNNSLLRTAWPAFQEQIEAEWQRVSAKMRAANGDIIAFPQTDAMTGAIDLAAAADVLRFAKPVVREPIYVRRLAAGWEATPEKINVTTTGTYANAMAASEELFERPEAARESRLFGTTVHALFEQLARLLEDGLPGDVVPRLRRQAEMLLRNGGLTPDSVAGHAALAIKAVEAALDDPDGRWVLGPHERAQTETSWTGVIDGKLRTLRVDRIFEAGVTPRTEGGQCLWIVDYKTAQYEGEGVGEFLAAERVKYSGQLESYGEMMRLARGKDIELRLALYYPLLKRLCWWPA